VSPKGHRRCRACFREYHAQRRARRELGRLQRLQEVVTNENFGDLLIESLKEAVEIHEGREGAAVPRVQTATGASYEVACPARRIELRLASGAAIPVQLTVEPALEVVNRDHAPNLQRLAE
jgi:hypothetical protein